MTSEKYVTHLVRTVFPMTQTMHLSIILLTHGHADHSGGVTAILAEMKRLGRPTPKIFKRRIVNGKYSNFDYLCEDICEGQSFLAEAMIGSQVQNSKIVEEEEEVVLRAVLSPGHTDDHVAFTLKVNATQVNSIASHHITSHHITSQRTAVASVVDTSLSICSSVNLFCRPFLSSVPCCQGRVLNVHSTFFCHILCDLFCMTSIVRMMVLPSCQHIYETILPLSIPSHIFSSNDLFLLYNYHPTALHCTALH